MQRPRGAILQYALRVSAFAISASFGVRNPEHELQLRVWVEELCDKPVTCGHQLASSLGAPRRALTVALKTHVSGCRPNFGDVMTLMGASTTCIRPLPI